MVNDIVKALKTQFDCRIYVENIEQGLKTPCFSILPLNKSGNREVGNRYKFSDLYIIRYFPSSKDFYTECTEVLKQLTLLLVDVGQYHASELSGKIVDGVLQFEVTYKGFITKSEDDVDMEDYNLSVKG